MKWALTRLALSTVGRLSEGVRIGYRHGFDSGTMLDYVYEDRPRGAAGIGPLIDRVYLNAIGWRAIRARAALLGSVLHSEIASRPGRPVRILDVAAGPGRYLQDVLQALPPADRDRVRVLCRDLAADGLRRGRELAAARGLSQIWYETGDAFDPAPTDASLGGPPDVIVVSGLYELILDEHVIRNSMATLRKLLTPGGTLVFTTQIRHPQLELIANVLPNRHGQPWVMTCRPLAEAESWAADAGYHPVTSVAESNGLFTVTTARV
jgi:SAM-dependent methyltransferase